jgi:hypothetical protein
MFAVRFFKTNMLHCDDNLARLQGYIPDERSDLGEETEVRSFEERQEAALTAISIVGRACGRVVPRLEARGVFWPAGFAPNLSCMYAFARLTILHQESLSLVGAEPAKSSVCTKVPW